MKDLGTVKLETGRLLLRPFVAEGAPAAYRNWCSDGEVTRYLTWPPHSGPEDTRAILEEWIGQYGDPTFYQWAIVWKETGGPIGSISVVEREEKTGSYHVGYCIGRPWWHRGVTTEAYSAVISFLFEEVGALRVESRHDPHNPNSGKVMAKCGLTYEGTLRQRDKNNQGICDAAWYGILRTEYFGKKGERG